MSEYLEKNNKYFEYDRLLIPAFPKVMLMETTNCCNHSCIFCSHSKMTRPKGFMREELAYRLLEEAYNEGTREVGFYMLGEPLLDRNLEKYIKYAKELGFSYTFLTTNGSILDDKRMISILNAGLDSIKFSLNGGNEEHYFFAHGKDDFQVVKDNIIRLSAYRKEYGCNIKIYISSVLTKYTQNDDIMINNIFSPYVDDIIIYTCTNQGGNMNDEVENVLRIENTSSVLFNNRSCFFPFNRLHITYEGYLTLCCTDTQNFLIVEDLNNLSLKDAWNSEKFQQIRKKHIDGSLEGTLCYNCLNNENMSIEPISKAYACPYDNDVSKRLEMVQMRIDSLMDSGTINRKV